MASLSILNYNNRSSGLQMSLNNANNNNNNDDDAHNINPATFRSSSNDSDGDGGGGVVGVNVSNFCKTFNKITVHANENNGNFMNINNNNNNNSSNVNTIVRKIKDFGMFGTVNQCSAPMNSASSSSTTNNTTESLATIVSKRMLKETKINKQPVTKITKTKTKESTASNLSKLKANEKINRTKLSLLNANVTTITKVAGTPGRKGLPLPQAVARRNARERNRVKLVNNGFAALRERIPEEVAEAFEGQGSSRGAAKKLSKVETLRMAVEYIRNLERLLGFDFPVGVDRISLGGCSSVQGASSGEDSFTIVKDEFDALSPGIDDDNLEDSLCTYDMDDYFSTPDTTIHHNETPTPTPTQTNSIDLNPSPNPSFYSIDLLPNVTTLNGLQYIRIPGTNTYQLLTPDLFICHSDSPTTSSLDDEHFNAVINANCLSPSISSAATTTAVDLHSSPPLIMTNAAIAATITPAEAIISPRPSASFESDNDECVNKATLSSTSASLSISPVPHKISQHVSSSFLHRYSSGVSTQCMQPTESISPVANEFLQQTCATTTTTTTRLVGDDRQFVVPPPSSASPAHMIKQEFTRDVVDFAPSTISPTPATTTHIYHATVTQVQHQQELLHDHVRLSISPPLDRCNTSSGRAELPTQSKDSAAGIKAFYEHDNDTSFYEGICGIDSYKKDLANMLLDTTVANAAATAGLSDESMMDAIDWWEAHTPKSDGGASVMLS